MKIKRGDIVLVDLGIHENSIQSGIRPCVIVSNDKANRYSPVFTVVPLTSRLNKKNYLPTHVFINAYQCDGLKSHSLALCEQMTTIAYGDILEVSGRVSAYMMDKIGHAMRIQIGV